MATSSRPQARSLRQSGILAGAIVASLLAIPSAMADVSLIATKQAIKASPAQLAPYGAFTGAGQKMQVKASIGTQLQDYEISFIEPWLFGKQLQFGVDLFHRYN